MSAFDPLLRLRAYSLEMDSDCFPDEGLKEVLIDLRGSADTLPTSVKSDIGVEITRLALEAIRVDSAKSRHSFYRILWPVSPFLDAEVIESTLRRAVNQGVAAEAGLLCELIVMTGLTLGRKNIYDTAQLILPGRSRLLPFLWELIRRQHPPQNDAEWEILLSAAKSSSSSSALLSMWTHYRQSALGNGFSSAAIDRTFCISSCIARQDDASAAVFEATSALLEHSDPGISGLRALIMAYSAYGKTEKYRQTADRLLQEIDSLHRKRGLKSRSGISALAKAALPMRDTPIIREAFLHLKAWNMIDPFEPQNRDLWAPLLNFAFALRDFEFFMEIFRYLRDRFNPLRHSKWGVIGARFKICAASLPLAYRIEFKDALYLRDLNVDVCLACLRNDSLPGRTSGRGEIRLFIGAGRSLMRWMIQSFMDRDETVFRARVQHVIEGVLSLPESPLEPRRSDAWFVILTRGQIYSGAIFGRSEDALLELLGETDGLSDGELFLRFGGGTILRKTTEILASVTGNPRDPGPAPCQEIENILKRQLTNLLAHDANDPELEDIFFAEMSALTNAFDTITCAHPSVAGTSLIWLVQRMNYLLIDVYAIQGLVHQFKHEVEGFWREKLEVHQDVATTASVIRSVVLVGRNMIEATRSQTVRKRENSNVGQFFQWRPPDWHDLAIREDVSELPEEFQLMLGDREKYSVIDMMVRELLGNAKLALEQVDQSMRTFSMSLAVIDENWQRLIVRNTFLTDGVSSPYSTGVGTSVIMKLAGRLRDRNGNRSEARSSNTRTEIDERYSIYEWSICLPKAQP